jgi:hypothetical protein
VEAVLLHELLAAWAPTIEEIHLEDEIKVDFGQEGGGYKALAACRQLRALSLQPQRALPTEFLATLSTLPHFRSLGVGLSWRGHDQPPSMPTLLRCMVDSRSWSELHLQLHPLSFDPQAADAPCEDPMQPGQAGGLSDREQLAAMQMDDRTAQRIRVYVYQDTKKKEVKTSSFHISSVDEATGKRVWHKE